MPQAFQPRNPDDANASSTETMPISREETIGRERQAPGVAEIRQLRRMLKTRIAELETLELHTEKLETEILALKDAILERKRARKEYESLRRSAEYRFGRVLLAPYRFVTLALRLLQKRFFAATAETAGESEEFRYRAW